MAQIPVQTLLLPDSDPGTTIYAKSLGSVPPITGNITVQINETVEKITNINQFITKESVPTAGGGSQQVQFNLNGQLAGDNKLTFDYITTTIRLEGIINSDVVKTDYFVHANGTPWHFYNDLDTSNYLANHAGPITGTTITTGAGTIGSLTSSNITSNNVTVNGNLYVNGTTVSVNVSSLNIKDSLIELGGYANGSPLTTDDLKDRGMVMHYYDSTPVDAFMGFDRSDNEFVVASNVTVSNNTVSYNTLGNLKSGNANLGNIVVANYFSGDGSLLTHIQNTHIDGQVANANIADQVYNNTQPNITSVGTLINLTVGDIGVGQVVIGDGTLTASSDISGQNISAVANINAQDAIIVGNITASSADLGNSVTANFFTGTLTSNSQPNITSVGNLVSLIVTQAGGVGNITADNIESSGNIDGMFIIGDGYQLGNITGANVTGNVPFADVAHTIAGANVTGEVNFAITANNVAGANVSGEVAFANVANNIVWSNVSSSPTTLSYFENDTNYITLANLSVDAVGPGSLTYDSSNGVFSYTGPVLPTSLNAFTNDPVFLEAGRDNQGLTTTQKDNAKTNLGLHIVATTGSYTDLLNTPTRLSDFQNDNVFVTIGDVASNGYALTTYVDNAISGLINGADPALDTLNELANALANDASFSTTIATSLGNRLRIDIDSQGLTSTEKNNAKTNLGLHVVATTGNYNDLESLPDLKPVATSGDYNDLDNLPTLSTVSATGSYNDLLNKPDLKTVATSGEYGDLINRPDFKTIATSASYNDLLNVPDFANLYVSKTHFDSVISQLFSLITDGGSASGFSSIDGGNSSSTFTTTIDGGVA